MRAILGLAGLVVVFAVVGILFKKQFSAMQAWVPAGQTAATAQQQQLPQKIKQQVEGLLQQARPMPEDQRQDE